MIILGLCDVVEQNIDHFYLTPAEAVQKVGLSRGLADGEVCRVVTHIELEGVLQELASQKVELIFKSRSLSHLFSVLLY